MCPDSRRARTSERSWAAWFAILVLVPCAGALAADNHWLDVESRIQYGYFTEDARALRNLVEPLAVNESREALKSYYEGLLAYRLTLLADTQPDQSTSDGKSATPARNSDRSSNEAHETVARCVNSLDRALKARSDFADALALQSACLRRLAELSSWRAPFAASKSATQLRKALQLAPKNPRVLLLAAIGEYEYRKVPDGAARGCENFKTTAAVFDAERADLDQVPGWGAADAYMWLGRCYLGSGDVVPARDALERALLIAPEFAQARRLLSSITSG
jgi:tetratricopeptide (TPR) repeat protein